MSSQESPRRYWEARALADSLWQRFREAQLRDDERELTEVFFLLTHFRTRTISILRIAIETVREPLAIAAMRNLIVLDKIFGAMHRVAPDVLPLA